MTPSKFPRYRQPDEQILQLDIRDYSGGQNNRQAPDALKQGQASVLYNCDLIVPGQTTKRPGSVLIGNQVGSVAPVCMKPFYIQGGTDVLAMYEDTSLWVWTGTGNWAVWKADFTAATDAGILQCKESGLSPDDVIIVQNGTDNAFRFTSAGVAQDLGSTAGTGSDSPPKTTVMCWYANRVWCLKNDLLYFSDAYPADYAVGFDTATNIYRVPVGAERVLLSTRDHGIIVMGKNAIWAVAPSTTPAATDTVEPILTEYGVVSKKGACIVGDDIYFFSHDGLRALQRTVQDKVQLGATLPISYPLKTEFESIAWSRITELSMEYFDNKLFIAVPTGADGFNTWVYYPATQAFVVISGWYPTCFSKFKISGEERLYYGKYAIGKVYRGWYGYSDEGTTTSNGTAIDFLEEGRAEDLGYPAITKSGGELKVSGLAVGNYDISVYASFDNAEYQLLGIATAAGGAVLPINLPFYLVGGSTWQETFHLARYGHWKTIKVKLEHNASTGTDTLTVYNRAITTYLDEYQPEV